VVGDVFSNGRRDREIATCEFDFHPNAPLLRPTVGAKNNRAVYGW